MCGSSVKWWNDLTLLDFERVKSHYCSGSIEHFCLNSSLFSIWNWTVLGNSTICQNSRSYSTCKFAHGWVLMRKVFWQMWSFEAFLSEERSPQFPNCGLKSCLKSQVSVEKCVKRTAKKSSSWFLLSLWLLLLLPPPKNRTRTKRLRRSVSYSNHHSSDGEKVSKDERVCLCVYVVFQVKCTCLTLWTTCGTPPAAAQRTAD